MKIIASCPAGTVDSDRFDLVFINKNRPHTVDTQVCAVNSLAAMLPASAGVGSCVKSMGTTKKPIVLRLPHHSAAAQSGNRDIKSDVTHRHHFVILDTARCLHFGAIADFLANQGTCNRAANVDQPQLDVSLVFTHNLVRHLGACFFVF